jgi:hypothetical protein
MSAVNPRNLLGGIVCHILRQKSPETRSSGILSAISCSIA